MSKKRLRIYKIFVIIIDIIAIPITIFEIKNESFKIMPPILLIMTNLMIFLSKAEKD